MAAVRQASDARVVRPPGRPPGGSGDHPYLRDPVRPGPAPDGGLHPGRGRARPAQRARERGPPPGRAAHAPCGAAAPRRRPAVVGDHRRVRTAARPGQPRRHAGAVGASRRDGAEAACDAADRAAGRDERLGARDPGHLSALRRHRPARRGVPGAHPECQLPRGPGRDRGVPGRVGPAGGRGADAARVNSTCCARRHGSVTRRSSTAGHPGSAATGTRSTEEARKDWAAPTARPSVHLVPSVCGPVRRTRSTRR